MFSGYDHVVVKDMAFYLKTRTATPDVIPAGYVHIFLIRHPAKSIVSFYKLVNSGEMEGIKFWFESSSFNFLWTMYPIHDILWTLWCNISLSNHEKLGSLCFDLTWIWKLPRLKVFIGLIMNTWSIWTMGMITWMTCYPTHYNLCN